MWRTLKKRKGKDPDSMEKQLLNQKSEREWSGINSILKGHHPGGLNELIIPDSNEPEQRKECYARSEIEGALLCYNNGKHLQTHNTPPLQEPLVSELRLKGDGPEVENSFNGEHLPAQGLDKETIAHSMVPESPMKDCPKGMEVPRISE